MKSAWEVDENEQWSEKVRRPWGEWCMCWGGGGGEDPPFSSRPIL